MKPLAAADFLSKTDYEAARDEIRRRILVLKERRRVLVGEHCSVHFETRETLRYQVHEMLRAENSWERAGALEDELTAYNPLVPGGHELSATVMFEYETPAERAVKLAELVGIDRHLWLVIGNETPIAATFDGMQLADGKISSVQFVRWPIDPFRRDLLRDEGTVVKIVCDHPHYRAQSVLSEQTRREIASDLD